MKLFFIPIFIIASLAHLYACLVQFRFLRILTKPLLLPLLAAIYMFYAHTPQPLVLAAMLLGCVGDIFLIFPGKSTCFMLGAISFALGHICYILALYASAPLSSVGPAFMLAYGALIAIPYIIVLTLVFFKLIPHLPADKKPLTPLYIGLICILSIGAVLGFIKTWQSWLIPILVGTLLFITSDCVLCFEVFHSTSKRGNFWVMSTYICAQSLLALGFILL
ncbi:MAG: lysoplasmalogenase [Clostridia bacterium]